VEDERKLIWEENVAGAFFLGQRYPKAGKRGQLLSKWGTVWRRVEEVLWRMGLEDFEISLTLEKLDETSNGKKDVKGRDTRKSWRRHNDCCDLSTANRFCRMCWDERKWSTIWWGLLRVTAQVLLWALRPAARLWIPL
jgi:hypothetical protein